MKTYDDWMEAQKQLTYWKGEEARLREKICTKILDGQAVGTTTVKKGKYTLKAVKKINYKFDHELLSYMWDDLSMEERAAVKYTPELRLKEYKKLEDHEMLDKAISTSPAMPGLTITVVE